jgi:hypothetical protein
MRIFRVAAIAMLLVGSAAAQDSKNELGFTLGSESVRDRVTVAGPRITFSRSIAFGANYARRLRGGAAGEFFLEFPFVAVPSHKIQPVAPGAITDLASLYVAPSLRVKFLPLLPVSPWVSVGGGYGEYEGSEKLANGTLNPDRRKNVAVAQFGAGVDVKTPVRVLAPVSLRGEFRDFYSFESVNYGVPTVEKRQHNFVLAGGFVLRF